MHGVFGLRITLGRPFPESLPVVSPTSSPSPLRNSPGFPPGSPRPHRGRTMHATQISTCARNSRRAVPPTPCRSRPPAPCRRRVGHVERCSTWTWGCGRGSTSTPVAIRFDKTPRATPRGRHHDPQHICHGDERATPRIADRIHHAAPGTATGWHHRWDVDDPKKPPLQKLWTPPTRGCAPVQGTGTSLVTRGTSHPRGISVRQAAPCHTTWQTPRSPTHLPQDRWAKTRSADRTTTSPGPAHTLTHTAKLAV